MELAGFLLCILMIVPSTDVVDALKTCAYLFKECRPELAKCLSNPSCAPNIALLQTCNNRPDEIECQIRCGEFRRREQNPVAPPEDVAGLNQNNANGVDLGGDNREVQILLLRRSQSHRAILSSIASITAVINSESQVDIAVKVDSMITSFRRRADASRLSDVDSGDSRAPSEGDIHKSMKYNVWTSTPNGNKKLDATYQEAKEKPGDCPIFLLFSVNTSGQFVGLAEMVSPVGFDRTVEYWQHDS
ncbi:hypothetical protein KIW84_034429 [Lathyrus oleraceus]|uniref:YTH domain-containing family protein n=1 Tax=Pisum sativum TaxID=3888 RepID=A0A9D4XYF1_PEA|nr:hypothetical protein KIW84_034429 [Pisum sativum]